MCLLLDDMGTRYKRESCITLGLVLMGDARKGICEARRYLEGCNLVWVK